MDPLSAVSLAGNLIQFIQFGVQLICKAEEIQKLGSEASHLDLEDLTRDFHGLTSRLVLPPRGPTPFLTPNETALNDNCMVISSDFIKHLEKLKVSVHRPRKWNTFRQALKTIWAEKDIKNTAQRLVNYKSQLELHLLVALK
jgi:hypothetical protein